MTGRGFDLAGAAGTVAPASPSRRRFLQRTAAALAAAPFVHPTA